MITEARVAEVFRKFYYASAAPAAVVLAINLIILYLDKTTDIIGFAGFGVLLVMVPASLIALLHFVRTRRYIEAIAPVLLLSELAFSFFYCSGNPKDWRAATRFVLLAAFGIYGLWLYWRSRILGSGTNIRC